MATIVQCPKCSARLQLPPSATRGMCPRCHTPVTTAPAPGTPTVQPKSPDHSAVRPVAGKAPVPVGPSGSSVGQAVKKLNFIAYLRKHFAATHWPEAFGICLAILSIPIVSLLKPILVFRGMCFVLAGALALSTVTGLVYVIQRLTAYFFRGERAVPIRPRSWMARLTYGGWMFLIPMGLWVGAEYFAPPQGLLATIVPDLRKEQARWLRLPIPEREETGSGTAASGDKKREPTRDTTAKGKPAQFQTESDDPFEVVEESPATKTSSKGKTPPPPNKSGDGDPFEVIKNHN